jgi:hypothetical protein
MIRNLLLLSCSLFLLTNGYAQKKGKTVAPPPPPQLAADTAKAKKPANPLADKTKSSRKQDGLFTFYQDTATGGLQLYVKKDQLGKEYIYQSFSINGPTSLYLNQSMHRANFVFKIEKAFDKIEISRVNNSFYYDPNNPVSKTKNVDKPEAVIVVEKIAAEDSSGYLIAADGLFLSEKLDPVKPVIPPGFSLMPIFNLGNLNPAKSKYQAVKSFPNNTDVVVDLAYDNPNAFVQGGPDITDARYIRVRMQHSLIEMPSNGFIPRRDDPRVGYFGQRITDQTSISSTPYKDLINRWDLKKKDPTAALSEPEHPIVFWVENTTPYEYRNTVVEAGLKWNAAFEKAGFKNAVQMKIMPDDADWDPADIRYNVIRWVSSANPQYGAIGPSFVNPKTGQILGADITIEWFSGSATPIADELYNGKTIETEHLHFPGMDLSHLANCNLASELKMQQVTGMTALEVSGASADEIGEMHKQFLMYLVLHEMGHTLGLNHNMMSSQMWSMKELNNKEVTSKLGLTGSVMDYPAINVALNRKAQGEYYTTVAGPYDIWAIEYGYKEFPADKEEAELKKILARSTDPKLAFGNDGDDMRAPGKAMDPRINIGDLSSDAIGYAEERFQLVNSLMGKLLTKYSKEGQSYNELRARYNALQGQRMSMVSAVSRYVGGVYIDRSFPEQKSTSKPYTPVSMAQQKRAIQVLSKYAFAPDAFSSDAAVYAYLQPQRRMFSQAFTGDDYKITSNALMVQTNGALAHLLHPATLQRVTNSRLYGNQYSVADALNDITNGIFAADLKTGVNVYRQNLQTAYVRSLLNIVEDKMNQYDDVAQAGALHAVKKIKSQMATAVSPNEETRAHRGNLVFMINKGLEAK